MPTLFEQTRAWADRSLVNKIVLLSAIVALAATLLTALLSFFAIIWFDYQASADEAELKARSASARLRQDLGAIIEVQGSLAKSALFIDALMDSRGRDVYLVPFMSGFRFPVAAPVTFMLCDLNGKWLAGNTRPRSSCPQNSIKGDELERIRTAATYFITQEDGSINARTYLGISGAITGLIDGFLVTELPLKGLVSNLGRELGLVELRIVPQLDSAGLTSWMDPGLHLDHVSAASQLYPARPGIGEPAIFVHAKVPRVESFNKLLTLAVAYLVASILLVALIVYRAQRAAVQVLTPLKNLSSEAAHVSRSIGESMPSFNAPHDTHQEINELGGAVATMVAELGAHESRLEAAVADRTFDLVRKEEYLLNLFDAASDIAIMGTDESDLLVVFNRGAENVLGFAAAAVKGRMRLEELLAPAERSRFGLNDGKPSGEVGLRMLEEQQYSGNSSWPCTLMRKSGALAELRISVRAAYSAAPGKGVLLIGRDVTESNRLERERRELEERLMQSQKMEAIGTFAGGIAHDFNNILAVILGNAELAAADARPNPQLTESISEITQAAQRGREVVQQILSFSRRQPGQRQVTDIQIPIARGIRLLRGMLPSIISLDYQTEFSQSAWADVDETQLVQVLLNLGSNAAQSFGGKPGSIRVRVMPDGSRTLPGGDSPVKVIVISVEDTGPGISEEVLERIFEPFFTTKPVGEGTGLGLSVVHGIVKSHGGDIRVTSSPAKGTRVEIILPMAEAPPGAGRVMPLPPAKERERQQQATIAYLDDDEALVLMLSRLLEKRGVKVRGYTHPEVLLKDLADGNLTPTLLLVDFNMPGKSGVEVGMEAGRLQRGLQTIVTSGYVTEALIEEARASGMRSVIFKAMPVEEYCDLIIDEAWAITAEQHLSDNGASG